MERYCLYYISGLLSIFYCFLICMAVPDNWTPTIIIWSFLKKSRDFGTTEIGVGFFAMFTNLFGNVVIFVPFGFFMPMASKYRSFFSTLFYSFGLSLCVETFQLLTKVGSFDVDDLLLNTIGGVIGYMIFVIGARIRRQHDHKKKTKNYRRR